MTETTGDFNLRYPISSDPVNVHGDLKNLAADVDAAIASLDLSIVQIRVINNSGATLPIGCPVYATGYTTQTTVAKMLPNINKPVLGLLKQQLANGAEGVVVVAGVLKNINTQLFLSGDTLYIDENGGLTAVLPTGNCVAVGVVAKGESTDGVIIVEAKGNGTWGALKNGLS